MTVYEIITERILKQMEQGTIPWRKPWKSTLGEEPANLVSKQGYKGINRFLLGALPFKRPYYVTYKQASELGGHVKKGEHGCPIIFWKRSHYTKAHSDGTETEETGFILRYYTVFNVEQCEGLQGTLALMPHIPSTPFNAIESAEGIVQGYRSAPSIIHKAGDRACYSPIHDTVTMPEQSQFTSEAEYYSTLFHELTHSTGHATRLNRTTLTELSYFGDQNYSREELVAEMGAAFLCGHANIENEAAIKNSAAYLDGWRKRLRSDSKAVILAAGQAQKAADHIIGSMGNEDASGNSAGC